MKLRNILIVVVIAPVLAYLASQLMWAGYELFNLYANNVTPAVFDSLTTALFIAVFGIVAVYGLMPKRSGFEPGFTSKTQGKGFFKEAKRHSKIKAASPSKMLNLDWTIKDAEKILKPSKRKAFLEFIIVGNGKDVHQKMPFKKNMVYKGEAKRPDGKPVEYKVKNENLLVQKRFLRSKKLVAIFQEDGKPLKIAADTSKVTAETLSIANRSTAIGKGLKEFFSTGLPLKKILFFVGIGVVAVVIIYVLMSGGL